MSTLLYIYIKEIKSLIVFLFPEKTDCKEVLRIAQEYDVQKIFKMADDYLYINAESSTDLLKFA